MRALAAHAARSAVAESGVGDDGRRARAVYRSAHRLPCLRTRQELTTTRQLLTAKDAKDAKMAKTAKRIVLVVVSVLMCFSVAADAQTLTGPALVKALQAGGHVIVMRHASSPRDVPPNPNPDNVPPNVSSMRKAAPARRRWATP